jgi:hypothetical protein
MARRKRVKRKRMTITEQYNRYATGLEYFGESFETKKRATSKGLKELKKHYYKLRKELREQGMVDLPTIAQAEKEILRQREEAEEAQGYRAIDDDLEELPYMEGTLEDETRSYTYIKEFEGFITYAIDVVTSSYKNPVLIAKVSNKLTDAYLKLQGIIDNFGAEYVEDYLANSSEMESLRNNTYASYDDLHEGIEDITGVVNAMLAEMRGEL